MKTRSLYFEDRKEYYRLKEAGLEFKLQVPNTRILKSKNTYFVNFNIEENIQYLNGSLSSPKKIPMADAKRIIKANIPTGYTPTNFYEAEAKEEQKEIILIMWREDEEIFKEIIPYV